MFKYAIGSIVGDNYRTSHERVFVMAGYRGSLVVVAPSEQRGKAPGKRWRTGSYRSQASPQRKREMESLSSQAVYIYILKLWETRAALLERISNGLCRHSLIYVLPCILKRGLRWWDSLAIGERERLIHWNRIPTKMERKRTQKIKRNRLRLVKRHAFRFSRYFSADFYFAKFRSAR